MEEQIEKTEEVSKKARIRYKKTITAVAVIVVLSSAFIGWGTYKQWQMRRGVEKFAQMLKQLEQEDYQRAMADTYGGKTPQETLQMYIDAVEKGDFELASKYFIGEKQEKELASLRGSDPGNIKTVLDVLKKVEIVDERKELGMRHEDDVKKYNMSESKEDYINRLYELYEYDMEATMRTKVDGYDFTVGFKKYPNEIWKIMEF